MIIAMAGAPRGVSSGDTARSILSHQPSASSTEANTFFENPLIRQTRTPLPRSLSSASSAPGTAATPVRPIAAPYDLSNAS